MKPTKVPTPSQNAIDKLEELNFDFPEIDVPDVELPDLPVDVSAPEAPTFPELSLPEDTVAEIDIPAAQLPTEIFDLG
ncbi:hypothetical protein [Ruegeria atlantica]|uniref:hypothetical protein n=1 Tax=Ruegeria atlantica TaxID=81569 RepID=UPI00147FE970|nr:hypothetical protein [Ruegeria atlantica]